MTSGQRQEGNAGRGARVLWALCTLSALAGGAESSEAAPATTAPVVINAIEFSGNKVTRSQILRQEMHIKVGDIAEPVLIEMSRQAIMDLGLFTSVRTYLEPRDNGVVLRVVVKEKYYILPVPKLNRDDDNKYSIGAEISLDNLAGMNQKLKLRYESEDSRELPNEKVGTTLLSYNYPRVFGSPWTVGTEISKAISPFLVGGSQLYKKGAWAASVQTSRWLTEDGPSMGWQLGGGLIWRRNVYDVEPGPQNDPYRDAQAVGFSALIQFVDVRDLLFSRSGEEYGYRGEFGAPVLGSDTHYTRHEIFYRKYVTFPERLHENIDIQVKLGLSSGDIFASDTNAYSIGGSKTLRGYDTGSFVGNSYVQINVQYLRPFFGYYAFRGVVFTDIGNVYPSNTEMHLGDLKMDIGIGFRWRLKSFVKVDLRVDAAYAHDRGEWKYFAGTNEIF